MREVALIGSPSLSLSLVRISMTTELSSLVVALSSLAMGGSLTGLTVIVTVAVLE